MLGTEAATGHTVDDQAETVMVNLLRGAGVSGLAGMHTGTRHPILAVRRAETGELCRRLDLVPVRDPTNEDRRFLRNRVRHELLPLCSEIAGRDVVPVLARQAGLMAADAELLDAVAGLIEPEDAAALARRSRGGRSSERPQLAGGRRSPPPAARRRRARPGRCSEAASRH